MNSSERMLPAFELKIKAKKKLLLMLVTFEVQISASVTQFAVV